MARTRKAPSPRAPDAAPASDAAGSAEQTCEASTAATHVLPSASDPTDPSSCSSVAWIDTALGGRRPRTGRPPAARSIARTRRSSSARPTLRPRTPRRSPSWEATLATSASASTCDASVITVTGGPLDCTGAAQLPVNTIYDFYGDTRQNEVKITRTFRLRRERRRGPSLYGHGASGRTSLASRSASLRRRSHLPEPGGHRSRHERHRQRPVAPATCLTPTGSSWSGQWISPTSPRPGNAIIVRFATRPMTSAGRPHRELRLLFELEPRLRSSSSSPRRAGRARSPRSSTSASQT